MRLNILFIFGFITLFIFPEKINARSLYENDPEKKESIFDMMYRRGVLKVNLYFDVEDVINNRKEKKESVGAMVFKNRKGHPKAWTVGVKVRGVYRRYNCSEMPPLKLNFKKSELKAAGLSKFDDYKLVTHCIDDEKEAKALVLKEYLAYKFYNHITDESFRVQLLQINYIDINSKKRWEHYGFIIEDLALLRDRIGAEKVSDRMGITFDSVNVFQYQKMAYFQYLIGNTDWGISPLKNVKLVRKNGNFLVIPYDFDYSGLVLPPYAKIDESQELPALKTRVFLGKIDNMKGLDEIRLLFLRNKIPMKRTTRELRALPWKRRRQVVK